MSTSTTKSVLLVVECRVSFGWAGAEQQNTNILICYAKTRIIKLDGHFFSLLEYQNSNQNNKTPEIIVKKCSVKDETVNLIGIYERQ